MATRSELVADAAVTVLAREGLRGLTHRAVDAEAALPDGSTSNCFRTRAALIMAIVDRLEHLDVEALTSGPAPDSSSITAVAASLADSVARMTSARYARTTRARIALLLDETAREAMAEGHRRFLERLATLLESAGLDDAPRAARVISDLLEGALVHAVSVPQRRVDAGELAAAVERLMRPSA
ncbi:TetR/AcrR family transcriptional regulator [Microbacterium sp. JZ31]|uniref:TetR/AcrR family transcriptional regulator n=1 Tax=Microbacterium sp. JZ31 TaxID=1906274 RepID=UPI001931B309|nr:TetR/AcrR family transcriptional regulator [Microbacterium sp. JZ31]